MPHKSGFRHLYLYVLAAIIAGGILGHLFPGFGVKLKPLGEGFIKLIRMVVAPIIFTTVVVGIAAMGNLKRVGRIGLKAFVYFEVVTTIALMLGWAVARLVQPGAGMNVDRASLISDAVGTITVPPPQGMVAFLLDIIPASVIGAFAQGNVLQVLFFSVMFGFALAALGEANQPVVYALEQVSNALMKMVGMIIKLAPVAAFGATAFTIAKFGPGSLVSLGKLVACVVGTCALFVVVGLGLLLKLNGISIWKFLRYIREELAIILGTASSEPVLPRIMVKLEALGCAKPLVGLVLPAGYSLNLDGTAIFLTMGALFIAQAINLPLTFTQELTVFLVCLVTSKGAAGVVGSAFITLTATLSSLGTIPVEGMVLIVGIDPLLAVARAMTNLVGNSVATIVIARWENDFDEQKAARVLNSE
jgi:aerobic C4-dicarboxylate transport protein